MQFIVNHSPKLSGKIKVPGDKSISHRSIMLGSLAEGTTKITGFLRGDDALATMQAFRDMGVEIIDNDDEIIIYGVGLHGLKAPSQPLDLGNSGTAIRLICGVLAGQNFSATLIGDESLSKRPMGRIITPLKQMGVDIDSNDGKLPLVINGKGKTQAIDYKMPMASAQVKSCVLLAGLYADDKTCVREPEITRDHSERMLNGFGVQVTHNDDKICLTPNKLKATNITVPSDISSAAFFMVAASIAKNADIILEQVNINPTRTGIIDILKLMGADITLSNTQEIGGEKLADIRVRSANLCGITVPENLVPLAIDEFPVIFIAMSCAKGDSVLTGAKELKVKECDRIAVMAEGLNKLGINNTITDDGIKITGGTFKQQTDSIYSHHDHRISMAFAVASCASEYEIIIDGVDNVKTSFPNFAELCNHVGMDIEVN
jgi:3-phosphoshikimate 1-carboxyvinyltransferase